MATSSSRARESSLLSAIYLWADERLGLKEILAHAQEKRVPQHQHSFWYYWGGLSLFFFIVQIFSGLLLLVYYRPGPEAYESVRLITYDIEFGWLVRSAHSWSANLMVLCVFVHMFSVFFMKAYRKPREFGWWSGLALLGLTMVFGFSGYLLPMDELSYFATKIGLEIPSQIPVVGTIIANLLRGGTEVTEVTVQRFFTMHAVLLPLIFIPVLMFHLWLVQKHGNAVPPAEEEKPAALRRSIPFFPNFFIKDLALWLIALNALTILAWLFPWQLLPQADALASPPNDIHPEWYFMSQFQLLKVLGRWFPGMVGEILGLVIFTGGGILWALIPLYDKKSAAQKRALIATWIGCGALAGLALLTIMGYWEIWSL